MRRRIANHKRSVVCFTILASVLTLVLSGMPVPAYGQGSDPSDTPNNDIPGGICPAIVPESTLQTVSDTYFGTPKDYCFLAAAGQGFEFSTCAPEGSAAFQSVLEIRSEDGGTLLATESNTPGCGFGQARLAWLADSDAIYRIRVRGFGSGNFTLGYREVPVPPCADAIEPDEEFQTVSDAIESGEVKDYCFIAIGGLSYEFSTCAPDGSADFDTVIEVRDALGRTVLAANDDYCGQQSYVTWRATNTGPVRVRVYGFGKAAGNFDLAYRRLPIAACTMVTPEGDFQREEGSISAGQFADYCFDAAPGVQYEFTTCSPGSATFATVLEMRTAFGDLLLTNGPNCGLQTRLLYSAANGARFRARIRGFGPQDAGGYRVAYRVVLPPPCIEITPETRLQFTKGTLSPNGFKDYCIDAQEGQAYEFRTCPPGSSSVSTAVELWDANATTQLSVDSRIGCTPNLGQQVLFRAPGSRRYRVRVRNQSSASGLYSLTHQIFTPPACTAITPERSLGSVTGTLAASSFKDYCFEGPAGQGYEFTTCPPRGSAGFPLGLEIRDSSSLRTLSVVSRTSCGLGQEVVFKPSADGMYRVRILSGTTGGSFTLGYQTSQWSASTPIPIANGLSITTSVAVGGRIYVIGGRLGNFSLAAFVNQLWAYDPATETWTRKADIPVSTGLAAYGAAAAVGESIYVFGGVTYAGSFQYLNTTWIYNTASNTWSRGADIPGGPRIGGVVAAFNGKIIIAGGANGLSDLNSTLEYDPATNTFTPKANMPSSTLGVGTGLVVAGRPELHVMPSYGRPLAHWVYDVTSNTWRSNAAPPLFGGNGPAAVTAYGQMYLVGGYPVGRTQIYDPDSNAWSQGPLLPGAVEYTSGAVVDGILFLMGGFDQTINNSIPFTYYWAIE